MARISGNRRTQPYRKGVARAPSAVLKAQKRGRTLYGQNPADLTRLATRKAAQRRRRRI